MLAIISTVVSILTGLVNLLKGAFGKTTPASDPTASAVAVENTIGQVSADDSRATTEQLNQDIQNANSANDTAVADVRSASSVREQQTAVDDAIARANAPGSADH